MLKEAGDSIKRFVDSGIAELGGHLGPLLWQFAPTKKFDAADFGGFLEQLPDKVGRIGLRHVIEVRHDSFCTGEFIALVRQFKMPVVYTDHAKYPNIADLTGDFVYARLQRGEDTVPTAYPPKAPPPGPSACAFGRTARSQTTFRASNPRRSWPLGRARCLPT